MDRDIKILTWNTQGNPLNHNSKKAELDMIVGSGLDVILLQECGGFTKRASYNGYTVYGTQQLGAFNNRCACAILFQGDYQTGKIHYSHTGRLLLWVRYEGIYVACVHCVSSNSAGEDRRQAARIMHDVAASSKPIIIGGDFNVVPSGGSLNLGTRTRSSSDQRFRFCAPAQGTHQGKQNSSYKPVLDYFLTRYADIQVVPFVSSKPFRNINPHNNNSIPSDHKWVAARFGYDDGKHRRDNDDDIGAKKKKKYY